MMKHRNLLGKNDVIDFVIIQIDVVTLSFVVHRYIKSLPRKEIIK